MTPDEIQARTGIPAKIVRSIGMVESGGHADAVRFEPHLFLRAVPGAPIPYTRGATGAASRVSAETNRAAFARAFAINPDAAVRSSSWGLYQDLGGHLLAAHGAPVAAVAAFDADPVGVSGDVFVRWVAASPRINEPARSMPVDFRAIAKAYNGCCRDGLTGCTGCDHYASRLEAAYRADTGNLIIRTGRRVADAAEATVALVSERPASFALAGFAIFSACAAFAWWAYSSKRGGVRRNRRRSSRRLRRNHIAKPVTVYAVGSDGTVKEVGVARGRAQFVKLVKASAPLTERFEVRGYYDALRDIGWYENVGDIRVSVPGGTARVQGIEIPSPPVTPRSARY